MSDVFERISRTNPQKLKARWRNVATCVDMHTGGEPLRVVLNGAPPLGAGSILACRRMMMEQYDHFRKLLMWEPRGHADMYGCLLLPPERAGSDFGVLFMHNEGYSTMCGHATLAIAKLALLMEWVAPQQPLTTLKIDAPCGQLTAHCETKEGKPGPVCFDNVPAFVQALDQQVQLPGGPALHYDLAFGGAFYAYVDARQLGLSLSAENYQEIIRLGREIKAAVAQTLPMAHPTEPELNFLYGTIFIEPSDKAGIHSRNVCVFADGEVDRSATGSGVSGRAAIHFARGELKPGQRMAIESITGSVMEVELRSAVKFGPYGAVIPRVYGDAWVSGFHEFVLDEEDIFPQGFLLR